MDCEQMLDLIHHYLDGGLSQWRQRAVTRHIVECPPCAVEHRFHVHYREVVATKCSEEMPFMVRSRICEALASADSSGNFAGFSPFDLPRQAGDDRDLRR
jgi:mycothiol system anti-sigma-R factor